MSLTSIVRRPLDTSIYVQIDSKPIFKPQNLDQGSYFNMASTSQTHSALMAHNAPADIAEGVTKAHKPSHNSNVITLGNEHFSLIQL